MNKEDIIHMAREAGFNVEQGFLLRVTGIDEDLEAFAALVAAAEREALMQLFTDPENQPSQYGTVTLDYHLAKLKEWEDRFERMSDMALAQPEQERNFCQRCGKRTQDIHTCTPPVAAGSQAFYGFPNGSVSTPNAGGKCVTAGETAPVKEIDPNQWAFDRGLEST